MSTDKKKEFIFYSLLAFAIPLLIILYAFRIWEMDLSVPMAFGGDDILGSMLIKGISEYGIRGLYINESIGMPELSSLVDSPFLDLSYGIEAFIISLFIKSSQNIFYVLYILSYPICSLTTYILLNRRFSNIQPINVLFSCAFAIVPYHFIRGMGHSTLSRYFIVPITIFIALTAYEEELKFGLPKRYSALKKAIFFLLCVLAGMGNIYYAFGGLVLVATASLVKGIRDKRFSVIVNEMMPAYYMMAGVFLGLFPKIYYTAKYGQNTAVVARGPGETEVYGLKIIQMLLPCGYNRIPILRRISTVYADTCFFINENSMAALGTIASIGFVVTCGYIVLKFSGLRNSNEDEKLYSRIDILSFFVLTLVLYATVGGIGTIVAYAITPEIRCLNRFSIIIACLSMAVLNIFVGYYFERCKKLINRLIGIVLLIAVVVFSMYSETLVGAKGWQDGAKQQDQLLRDFFDQVEDALPEGSMVYQLPYVVFPEGGNPVDMAPYEHGLAYVYTDNLKWSYGAVKGRDKKSAELYIDDGMSYDFVDGIKEAGFSAVYVDTHGYDDGGKDVIDFYSSQLGLEPISSPDGWLYVFKFE